MKKGFIIVHNNCFSEMGLNPTEAVVYSLVAGYCKAGQRYERKVDEIAKCVNMTERGVRKVFSRLIAGGYLTKERKQLGVEYKLSDKWRTRTEQSSEQERNKVPRRTEQSSEQERNKVPNTPFNNKLDNNNPNNNGDFGRFEAIILEIFVAHYAQVHGGQQYKPDYTTQTTALRNLTDNVKAMMEGKYVVDADTVSTFFKEWISAAWSRADEWHRQRWSLSFINSQINYFNTVIIENGNTETNNNSRNGKGQRQFSRDFVEKYMRIAGIDVPPRTDK